MPRLQRSATLRRQWSVSLVLVTSGGDCAQQPSASHGSGSGYSPHYHSDRAKWTRRCLQVNNKWCEVTRMEMDVEVMKDPNWILDRRNSGRLFWRRDSVSEGNRNRVKFRCDVEVLEFLRTEAERDQEDWSSEDEDDCKHRWRRRLWDEEIPPPSNLWGSVCVLVIAAVLTYQWFSV